MAREKFLLDLCEDHAQFVICTIKDYAVYTLVTIKAK